MDRRQTNVGIHFEKAKTASKGHDIKTKMEKIKSQGDLTKVNLWNIFQQISGLIFVNPNIPALKYGREKEIYAVKRIL